MEQMKHQTIFYLQVLNHKVSADMESLAKRASQLSSQFGDRFVSDYTEKISQIEQECKQAMRMKHWMPNALLIVVYDRAFARTTISLLLLGSKLDKTGIGSRCGSQLATAVTHSFANWTRYSLWSHFAGKK